MSSTLLTWGGLAVLLFWAVGAYNRLVRLRSEASTAFVALEAELGKWRDLAQSCLPPQGEQQEVSAFDGHSAFWSGLEGAVMQFGATLAAARQHPLDPEGMAALDAARGVLNMAWERAGRADTHDLAGSRLPDTVIAAHGRIMVRAQTAAEAFNQAVARYNQAVAQFPALLLAWLFGFKPAGPLGAIAAP